VLKVTKGTHILVTWVITPCLVGMVVLEEHCTRTFIVQGCTLMVEILSSCEMLPQLRLHVLSSEDRNMKSSPPWKSKVSKITWTHTRNELVMWTLRWTVVITEVTSAWGSLIW